MIRLLFLFFSFSLFFSLYGCHKDECNIERETTFDLLHADTAVLPYTGYDSLFFEVSDSSLNLIDTVWFVGKGKKYIREWVQDKSHGEGCREEQYGNGYIMVFHSQKYPYDLSIKILGASNLARITVKFKDKKYEIDPLTLDGKVIGFVYPSIAIGGKDYYRVQSTCDEAEYNPDNCEKFNMLMNSNFGVLQITQRNYTKLTLLEKR